MSFTYDRLGRCFRFVHFHACVVVFLCCCRFSVNKNLYTYMSEDDKKKYTSYIIQNCPSQTTISCAQRLLLVVVLSLFFGCGSAQ